MALLTMTASITAPTLAKFFRGRTLDLEARRLLAMTRNGQNRAISEGIPIDLWVDPTGRTVGLDAEPSFEKEDPRAVQFDVDSGIRIDVVKRMARLADISFADRAPEGSVQLLVRGEVAALPLKGVIDFSAEKARLDKELAKADADIKRVDAKLANEKFVANAPEEIVDEEKEKREAAVARKAKILEALERLKKAG